MKPEIAVVGEAFQLPGVFVSAAPYGSGHINDTYAAVYDEGETVRYIFQRINHTIFKDVPALMANIQRVTQHIRMKLQEGGADDIHRRVLTLIPTRDGGVFHVDAAGNYWRVYVFIEGAQTFDVIETPSQAHEAAKAFAGFQKLLADLPGPRLHETIPDFHHTRKRFDALRAAIDADVCNRAAAMQPEIAWIGAREAMVDVLPRAHAAGDVPERITHNDTKLNNVMIDDCTGEGICVIDLDTVMPGLVHYDFGDLVRTAVRPTREDELDLSRVQARTDMFEAVARGYLEVAGGFLGAAEKELLAVAPKLITFELGIRYLTDYLQGDVYFKTHRVDHNRDRCRVQLRMVKSLEEHEDEMARFIASVG